MSWDDFKPSDFVTRSEFGRLHADLQENTRQTKLLAQNTNGVVEAFQAASGAFKTLEIIGRFAKPFLVVGGVISAITTWYVNFHPKK